jgi:thiol:disulfide interchange protein DsbC
MKTLIKILLLLAPLVAFADGNVGLATALERLDVGGDPNELPAAPVPGFIEVSKGTSLLYLSRDGRLLIDGDIVAVDSGMNLTERRRAALRLEALQQVPESDRIIFPSIGEAREKLIVFTDTDCRYCERLHRQLDEYARAGIEVQYIFYPRSGPASESFAQAVAAWCARDSKVALDSIFAGKRLPVAQCANPVSRHHELATELGLKGTPAIVTADGTIHYGVHDVDGLFTYSTD